MLLERGKLKRGVVPSEGFSLALDDRGGKVKREKTRFKKRHLPGEKGKWTEQGTAFSWKEAQREKFGTREKVGKVA